MKIREENMVKVIYNVDNPNNIDKTNTTICPIRRIGVPIIQIVANVLLDHSQASSEEREKPVLYPNTKFSSMSLTLSTIDNTKSIALMIIPAIPNETIITLSIHINKITL